MSSKSFDHEEHETASYCRLCFNGCAIKVKTDHDGKLLEVTGDRDDPLFEGYTCVKGRRQPQLVNHPDRLLTPLRRRDDGTHVPISSGEAIAEIARELGRLRDEFGPDSVAFYRGTMASNSSTTAAMFDSFAESFGSKMRFTPGTIDKPGKLIAQALHGRWNAPVACYDDPEAAVLVGINPPVSYQGAPRGNPTKWLSSSVRRGMDLIVIDPRETETARRATIYLQPKPGQDAAILAAFVKVILDENLYDAEFVQRHVGGLDRLKSAVARFELTLVARLAGIPPDALTDAARRFGRSRRGYVSVGTGPNMSDGGTLVEYLALCLDTLCGHVAREGQVVRNAPTLLSAGPYRAQMSPPTQAVGFEPRLTASGLAATAAGAPVAGLPAEMLRRDSGRVRALVSCGGNPASAWPGQRLVVDALKSLDLLVQIDPWFSNTAALAHFVIAPSMPLEQADFTQLPLDVMSVMSAGYGLADSYANVTSPVATPPPSSDVLDEWEFFYELAKAMGLPLVVRRQPPGTPIGPFEIDMQERPSTEHLLEVLATGSRVALDEVRRRGGGLYPDPPCIVGPAEPNWSGRADVGDASMMAALDGIRLEAGPVDTEVIERPFRLVPRRVQFAYNSSHDPDAAHDKRTNPAYMNPDDMEQLGFSAGDIVVLESDEGRATAEVAPDRFLRRGVVSLSHCYGGLPGDETATGVNSNLLVGLGELQDFSGQPRMSDVPVDVYATATLS